MVEPHVLGAHIPPADDSSFRKALSTTEDMSNLLASVGVKSQDLGRPACGGIHELQGMPMVGDLGIPRTTSVPPLRKQNSLLGFPNWAGGPGDDFAGTSTGNNSPRLPANASNSFLGGGLGKGSQSNGYQTNGQTTGMSIHGAYANKAATVPDFTQLSDEVFTLENVRKSQPGTGAMASMYGYQAGMQPQPYLHSPHAYQPHQLHQQHQQLHKVRGQTMTGFVMPSPYGGPPNNNMIRYNTQIPFNTSLKSSENILSPGPEGRVVPPLFNHFVQRQDSTRSVNGTPQPPPNHYLPREDDIVRSLSGTGIVDQVVDHNTSTKALQSKNASGQGASFYNLASPLVSSAPPGTMSFNNHPSKLDMSAVGTMPPLHRHSSIQGQPLGNVPYPTTGVGSARGGRVQKATTVASSIKVERPPNYATTASTSTAGTVEGPAELHYACYFKTCNYEFTSKKALMVHLEDVHGDDRLLHRCQHDGCSFDSYSKATMRDHLKRAHNGGHLTYRCRMPGCNFRGERWHELCLHHEDKHRENNIYYACMYANCNYRSTNESELGAHLKKMHKNGKTMYYCDRERCNFSTEERSLLQTHTASEHGHTTGWNYCPHEACTYRAERKEYVNAHLALMHKNGTVWYPCPQDQCKYRARQKATLKRHLYHVHDLGGTWYRCDADSCLYASKRKGNLKRHKQLIHKSG